MEILGKQFSYQFDRKIRKSPTELDSKHMRAIVWLNENNLVFMVEVQRLRLILLDRKVEDSCTVLHERIQVVVVSILRCDEFGTTEPKLWRTTPWDEDGGVVNRD